jgi:hypothetical protein
VCVHERPESCACSDRQIAKESSGPVIALLDVGDAGFCQPRRRSPRSIECRILEVEGDLHLAPATYIDERGASQ